MRQYNVSRDPIPSRRVQKLVSAAFRAISQCSSNDALDKAAQYAIGVIDCAYAAGVDCSDSYAILCSGLKKRIEERRAQLDVGADVDYCPDEPHGCRMPFGGAK